MTSGSTETQAGTGEPAISVRSLRREFTDLVAVRDLSFDVRTGELFGLVGPDGAGKTTTLRMLAGVLTPTSGDAVVSGFSMAHEPESAKHILAYMPQRFGLYEDLTVAENLAFYADLFGVQASERAERLQRLYEFSRLGEFEDRLAGALSGGMKQKLSLSCALIHQPRVLLLDEPTFGVDPISRRELWLIVLEMVEEGVTVVVSTSYMEEAERFDRVALLDEGRIIALDTPSHLEEALEGRLFHVQAEELRDTRDRLRDAPGVTGATLFGNRIHVLLAQPDPAAATRLAAIAGVDESAIEPKSAGLEDVFLSQVGSSA